VIALVLKILLGSVVRFKTSPFFRGIVYAALATAAMTALAFYVKHKIIENYEAEYRKTIQESVNEAVRAGDDAVSDPSRLRERDRHRRP
jgi:hypothetical protein